MTTKFDEEPFIVTLFGGILAGIVVTILVVYLINELMDTPKWLIGLMGLFLLFFLSFQFTAIIGAGKVKGVVEDITGLSNTVSGKVDWNNIETTYPVLKPYLDKVGTKVDEVSDQKTSALSLINSIINGFMWRRAAWALGGVMICFVVAALPALTGNGRNRQGQRGASASTRHRTTQHTSRSHRPRRR
ncbi:hypothetical protein DWV30_23405 [Bacteroides ovatus]|uniref:Uncharacterized protein n=2 Tax=Bacteroides TaxID=816 RepID=A0A413EGG2_BACOV|nr:hypothetical protein DWZ47_25870 [Bacteroides sp. AF32-8BH]RGX05968.1 hypothetical protein DWV35_23445 [Bacteroides ovatus]RGX17428.1 hypothetical protein DWV30_23405 [Bacteroides ovatus]